jgi:hypothetical protein
MGSRLQFIWGVECGGLHITFAKLRRGSIPIRSIEFNSSDKYKDIMTTDTNILGFNSFIHNGERHYGCRGLGKDYSAFYAWVSTTSYHCTSDDWPWDYFIFKDPKDEEQFLSRYSHLIDYQDDEA